MKNELNFTLVQPQLFWEAPEKNRKHLEALIAAHPVGDVILLPEMFTSGFTMHPERVAESMKGPTVEWLRSLARRYATAIGGSTVIKEGEQFYNRFLFVSPDGTLQFYDKRHTFTLAGEHNVYTTGQNDGLISYKGWKICLRICYDLRFPAWSRNSSDYDVLIYVANWPVPRVHAWDTLLKARAIENMAYVVGVNCVGADPNNNSYPGHSAAYDALGQLLSNSLSESEAVLQASFDYRDLMVLRKRLPFLQDRDALRLD